MGGPARSLGWAWFAIWAAVGAFSAVVILVFGVLGLPVAALAVSLAARRSRRREALGAAGGIGLVMMYVAYVNRGYSVCPSVAILRPGPPTRALTCGGLTPLPWLVGGVALAVVAILAYALTGRPAEASP